MKFIVDIYLGDGVQPTPRETIEVRSTREARTACRKRALRIWPRVVRCSPAGDGVVSYGPASPTDGSGLNDGYVTLRRIVGGTQ